MNSWYKYPYFVLLISVYWSFSSCVGFSLITNMVIMEHDTVREEPNHKEVMETANQRAKDMQKLVKAIVGKHGKKLSSSPSKL